MVRLAIENDDQKAYAELLHRYRESVFFTMLKMCNNKDDAEDLTIEAFGRAFKKLDQYSPDFAFSTWLFKIASNNAIDFLRKKKQKQSVSLDNKSEHSEGTDHSANIKASTLDPEETFIKKQKMERLRVLVDNLKPKYKEMIELFYFQELSHEEISQKLNLPIGTIKAQLFRARDLLYNAFKHGGDGRP
ncbi:MAG: sigma-70 family RNA polymerase sigma factor [Bacteroidia bacterium]|nr:sigma-70 family RNA polymerase sigma factor [Bacteroidia bacterium]